MGSIIRQRSFEAQRDEREPPVEYSLEREPWKAFRSSLAVQFASRRHGSWSADQLSEQSKAEIIAGLEARSVIISSYSRIQSSIRDLATKAGFSAQRDKWCGAYSAASQDVLRYARSLMIEGGPLSRGRQPLENLFDRIELTAKAAELFVHGFVEVREETSGAILFRFQQWGRRQSSTSKELEAKAAALELLAREAKSRLAAALALVKSESENRSEGRSNVFLTATLDTGHSSIPVRIRNLSSRGALIDGPALPSVGTRLRLLRGRLTANGELAWEGTGQAGVTLGHEINVDDWVQRMGHTGQRRVDGVIAALRRRAPVPKGFQAASNAGSLASMSAALDQICERVAAMPNMSVELGEELLKLEDIARSLRRPAATDK